MQPYTPPNKQAEVLDKSLKENAEKDSPKDTNNNPGSAEGDRQTVEEDAQEYKEVNKNLPKKHDSERSPSANQS